MIFSLMHQSWSNGFWKEIFCMMLFSINCKEPNIEWNTMLTRTEKDFVVDDLVYHKLQPYIQSSVAPRSNQKLSFPYYGPFKVLARVGAIAYRLHLLDNCKIHPVVHISRLKHHVPAFCTHRRWYFSHSWWSIGGWRMFSQFIFWDWNGSEGCYHSISDQSYSGLVIQSPWPHERKLWTCVTAFQSVQLGVKLLFEEGTMSRLIRRRRGRVLLLLGIRQQRKRRWRRLTWWG